MAKLLSRLTFSIDGQVYETELGVTFDLGGVKRTARPGVNSAGGFTEELVNSKIEADIQVDSGTRLAAFQDIDESTCLLVADTGQTYLIPAAYVAEPITFTGGEGKAKLVVQGAPAEEIS